MTRIVQALESDGLARRQTSAEDKRAVILRATKKGEQILERARQRRLSRIEALLESAAPTDIVMLEQALSRVFPGSS